MSLRRYLNVAFNILVEEYQRLGIDLLSALEKVSEWGEGAAATPVPVAPSPVQSAQNEASMAAIQGMLSGVEGSPVKKPRRA